MKCLDCLQPILPEHQFCPSCGQKTSTQRLQLKSIAADILQVVTDADRGFFPLIWQLIRRPGTVARAYVEGHRKSLFPPFSFLFLVVGVATFFVLQTHFLTRVSNQVFNDNGTEGRIVIKRLFQMAEENYNLMMLLSVPIFALWNRIFFAKSKLFYAEHLILAAYVMANYYTLFYIVIMPATIFFPNMNGPVKAINFMVLLFYPSWATRQFLQISGWKNFILSLLPPILAKVFPVMVLGFLIGIGMALGFVEISESGIEFHY